MKNKPAAITLGLAIANLAAAGIMYLSAIIVKSNKVGGDAENILIFSDFVIVPIIMGIISAWFWRDLGMRNVHYFLWTIPNTLLGLSFSWLFMGEGYICLIIVSPLVWGFIIAGTFIGKFMFRKQNRTMNASLFGVLLVILTIDNFSGHHYLRQVSDVMVINARPEKVWQHVVAYEPNRTRDNYWLFKIGMPSPVQSTVDGWCAGANRKCIFSNGYVFDEKMIVFDPGKELTFDITHQPRDPEIMGHIDILRGQFILKDNKDGTTTLTGTSWYKLYVFPAWYYDLWAESITRNVHLRVMDYIKQLSEKNV